jgi:hypothetical protein
MTARHFPPPWSAEELDACFDGQKLAYIYFEDEPGQRSRGDAGLAKLGA